MGYRSQVTSIIYGEPDKVKAFKVKAKLTYSKVFESFKDNIKDFIIKTSPTDELGCIELESDIWKWYSEYPDVKAWHEMLEDAVEFGLSYEFVRIGEDRDDIVVEEGNDDVQYFLDTFTNVTKNY